jgi:hypothetical protein
VVSHSLPSFMALIECYECGREISSLAPNCINCGAPKKSTKKKKSVKSSDRLRLLSQHKTVSVELTERQREQIKSIGTTSSKTPTKKKTVKKRAAKTQRSDDIGEHKSSYRQPAHWLSGSEPSPKKTVKKKKVKKASPKKPVARKDKADGDGDFGMFADIVKNTKKEESGDNLNLTNKARWWIKLFVIYVCMFLFIGITGLALALPGWGIGLIYGITTTVYVLNRGGPPAD